MNILNRCGQPIHHLWEKLDYEHEHAPITNILGHVLIFSVYFKGHTYAPIIMLQGQLSKIGFCCMSELFGFRNDVIWKIVTRVGFTWIAIWKYSIAHMTSLQRCSTTTTCIAMINVRNMNNLKVAHTYIMQLETTNKLTRLLNVCKDKIGLCWTSPSVRSKMLLLQCTPNPKMQHW